MIKQSDAPSTEFPRPIEVARVPNLGSHEKLMADPKECIALAKRLDIPAIYSLTATLKAKPWRGGGLKVTGELSADLNQLSVVSLEAFRSQVVFPVERYFLNIPPSAEFEFDEEIDPIIGGIVDLGEIVAETLALELDPYPRKAGEVFQPVLEDAPTDAEKRNPFNVLRIDQFKK